MKARPSSSICSKARRASRRATSYAPHKISPTSSQTLSDVWRGFFIWQRELPPNLCGCDSIFVCLLDGYYTVHNFMSSPPDSAQRYDFTGLTPNDYMDMDLSSIFGLNSCFGAVLGRITHFPHGFADTC